ncbi:hypothetical protein SESBI_06125 [Sesbania bispinosa]|nr:hypothetical protein SESBI_06125 [Sesbania bispinosa]
MVKGGRVKMGGAEPETMKDVPRVHSTEVLHQRSKMPHSPMRMAMVGFAAISVLGYFVLYSNKKPEASALDVAKVSTGLSHPDNTRPRN